MDLFNEIIFHALKHVDLRLMMEHSLVLKESIIMITISVRCVRSRIVQLASLVSFLVLKYVLSVVTRRSYS